MSSFLSAFVFIAGMWRCCHLLAGVIKSRRIDAQSPRRTKQSQGEFNTKKLARRRALVALALR